MTSDRKKRLSRVGFILGGLLLLMNGLVALGANQPLFGSIQLVAAGLNIGMLFKSFSERSKQRLEALLFLMNSVMSLFIAIGYVQSGAHYIQYVWIFSALLYVVVFFIRIRKKPVLE